MTRSLYLIGIGGTGAKAIEAVVQLASAGVLRDVSIKILHIDADETNGNLIRAGASLAQLQASQSLCPWMDVTFKSYGLWSPFAVTTGPMDLAQFFAYNNIKADVGSSDRSNLGHLFDMLYTKAERTQSLDEGFRGRPAIGSAIMSRIDLDSLSNEPWTALMSDIRKDADAGITAKILLLGSIFGGTGASGLPTIGRLLTDKLAKENLKKAQVGAVFFLPYFQFQPRGQVDELYARADLFSLNTESALRYYRDQARGIFSYVYLLGCSARSSYEFSTGKQDQANQAHVVEIYSTLAAEHFLCEPTSTGFAQEATVVLMSRGQSEQVTWMDIPGGSAVQEQFAQSVRFAYLWLDSFYPTLVEAKALGPGAVAKAEPWFAQFFRARPMSALPPFDEKQMQTAEIVQQWCQQFWKWLYSIHYYSGEGHEIALFICPALDELGVGMKGELLPDLVEGRQITDRERQADTVRAIKLELQQYRSRQGGIRSLVKALYDLSKLRKS